MTALPFENVRSWVFDLDNTLYAPEARLFDQIEVRMTTWVMAALDLARTEADTLRRKYWRAYGTTLAGLMAEHDVDPGPYLNEVHDIDLSHLRPDPGLAARIADLPGRKFVFTNGCAPYANRVLAARGLDNVIDAVFGVEHAGFQPKPNRAAYEAFFATARIDPRFGAMFEDDPRNLAAPHQMGMRTVHVADHAHPAPHIHHHTSDLTEFLTGIGDAQHASQISTMVSF
jgi:putative hydrolase of the HAD superfamily